MSLLPLRLDRYLFTLDLPEYWENKHADQTLEVLMSDLDPAIMDQFYMKDGVSASDVTRVSGRLLTRLPPGVGLLGVSDVMRLFILPLSLENASFLSTDEWNT